MLIDSKNLISDSYSPEYTGNSQRERQIRHILQRPFCGHREADGSADIPAEVYPCTRRGYTAPPRHAPPCTPSVTLAALFGCKTGEYVLF